MASFEFVSPAKIIFGCGKVEEIGNEVRGYGRRVLLVTGRRAIKETGILKRVVESLSRAKVEVTHFDSVPPEPTIDVVNKGVTFCSQEGCDLTIGLGGGSVLDVAKAVAYLVKKPGIPFIAIPTTAGTGSEASFNSVITYPTEKKKKSIRDHQMMAKLVIIDPELILRCPKDVTIFSGLDALVHLIEGFVSRGANPLTDSLALSGIRLIHQAIRKVVREPCDIEDREKMSLAALMGGIVLANAGLGAVHGLAGSIGGKIDAPHGLICAVLLPWIVEYNLTTASSRFGQIAEALDSVSALDGIRTLLTDLEIPPYLGPLGVKEEDLPLIVCDASSSIKFNPRETDLESLVELLKRAI